MHHDDDHGDLVIGYPGSGASARTSGRGQALAEFALAFPVVALLIFGAVDLGRAVYAYSTIANAARQGARVAAVNQILTSPECNNQKPVEDPANPHWSVKTCAAASAISLGIGASAVSVSFGPPAGGAVSCAPVINLGCIATVTVHYTFAPMTPVISSLVGPMAMDATSQMPIERVFP